MDLGNRLYELRKAKKISQEEAAEKLNVSRQTISKWETNQSQPDFDKIIPICTLYDISTEVLFGEEIKKKQEKQLVNINQDTMNMDRNKKTALVVSVCVFFYFLAVIWIIMTTSFSWLNEIVAISVFLFICAIATVILIYHFVSMPKQEESIEKKRKKEIEKYDGIVALLFTCIYLWVSFVTMAWHISWLIWIVYALVIEIIHLILGIKENQNEE